MAGTGGGLGIPIRHSITPSVVDRASIPAGQTRSALWGDKPFHEQLHSDVERLCRDGTWAYDPKARDGIWRELFWGGFNESQDELSEEEVGRLFQEWSTIGWPSRE